MAENQPRTSPQRHNPFQDELPVDERHYCECSHVRHCKQSKPRPEVNNSGEYAGTSIVETADRRLPLPLVEGKGGIEDAELGLCSEEGGGGLSRLEELELAMGTCKDLIAAAAPHTDHHKALVAKLVSLRFQAQELKEASLVSLLPTLQPRQGMDYAAVCRRRRMRLKARRRRGR